MMLENRCYVNNLFAILDKLRTLITQSNNHMECNKAQVKNNECSTVHYKMRLLHKIAYRKLRNSQRQTPNNDSRARRKLVCERHIIITHAYIKKITLFSHNKLKTKTHKYYN